MSDPVSTRPPPARPRLARSRPDHIAWLHAGGPAARWANLGLWPQPLDERAGGHPPCAPLSAAAALAATAAAPTNYAEASMALAAAVGEAAGIGEGDIVLSLGCGGGEELALWAERFGAAGVMGLEVSASLAAQARQRVQSAHASCAFDVRCADARALPQLMHARFDRIVAVDSMFLLGERLRLMRAARSRLNPGGSIAYTDLVHDARGGLGWRRTVWRAGAALAGVAGAEVRSEGAMRALLHDAGFVDVRSHRLDDAVLAGFCRHVERQSRLIGTVARASAGWRRVALVAGLIRTGLAAGLGHALFSGRVPGNPSEPGNPGDAAA